MIHAQLKKAQPEQAADAFHRFRDSDISQLGPEPVQGYKLHGKLGVGGMGSIYLADDPNLNLAALKLVPNLSSGDPMHHLMEWFTRECAATMILSHPNVVSTFGAGETKKYLYLSLEVLEGGNLRELLTKEKRLTWASARRIALDVCAGLEAVHATGIIHRDLKTENVMFTHPDQGRVAKLIDFGLCHIAGYDEIYPHMKGLSYPIEPYISPADGTFGTPEYRAPEYDSCGMNKKPTFDLYSVGVMLYEMVAGRHPFEFEGKLPDDQRVNYFDYMHKRVAPPSIPDVAPDAQLPKGAPEAIMRALEKDPAKRFQTAAEMRRAIAACA